MDIHGGYKPTYEYETSPKAMPDECRDGSSNLQ